MKTPILTSCVMLFIVTCFSQQTLACSCELPPPNISKVKLIQRAIKSSNAVFSGEVIELVKVSEFTRVAKIRIKAKWKGVKDREVYVSTGNGEGDCGFPFEIGKVYLVYTTKSSDGKLSTNICQRTNLLSLSEEDLQVLKKPK